ncbi:MAG TPA: hypothetical protein VF548_03765 [Allosphingosinicella sp.]
MAFPISITGTLTIPIGDIGEPGCPASLLQAALEAEKVDRLHRRGDTLSFRAKAGLHAPVERPGGEWWLFAIFDRGEFALIGDSTQKVTVRYSLSVRLVFFIVTALSVAAGLLIYFSSGPDHEWGFAFGLGLWLVAFASQYASKAIEVRRWLRKVLTQRAPYAAAPLRTPSVG